MKLTNKQYIGAPRCPKCGSDGIEEILQEVELNDTRLLLPVICGDCGASWVEFYGLYAYRMNDDLP